MTPGRWEQICEILDKALSLEGQDRERYLASACDNDPDLRGEVESLLESHDKAGSHFLNVDPSSADETFEKERPPSPRIGRRIGPYLIVEEIGHGGMGEVFAAVRADGQYEKKVALKLVRSGYDTQSVIERFHNERQILATLDHPNIARLLDGGTTEDGVPYLVMELVQGAPIDSYCDAHKLSVTDRLRLFQQVCAAVQYAHQRLVIHRDIKPSNIPVTQEGTPKLLDFGIAKILDASGSAEATVLRPMTPEYASPEQIRGDAITTATDAYSLGVVLYQLVTGRSPYRIDTPTPAKLAEAIMNGEPERPSTSVKRTKAGSTQDVREPSPRDVGNTREASPLRLQRRLRGDLDYILLKALRKEPEKRYSSVEQFAEDIRRHLEGLPVTARKGTWSYRSGKFIHRNRIGVGAAALVLLTLAAGIVVTVREARIAGANRKRAEKRFNDVRKLANSLIFEIHDSIQDLPGATPARKLIMQRSLEYLDGLTKESGNDPSLLRELATAYGRIGELQGNPTDPNLGDTKAALASYQKSMQIRESLARSNPKNSEDQVELAVAYLDYSDFERGAAGNVRSGYDYCKKAVAILDREAASSPADFRIFAQSARAYSNLGIMQVGEGAMGSVGTVSGGIADLQKSLKFTQGAIRLAPTDVSMRAQEGGVSVVIGDAMLKLGDRLQALAFYRRALDILQALNARGNNVKVATNTVVVTTKIGDAFLVEGKNSDASAYYSKAERMARQLAAADPHDALVQQLVVTSSAELGYGLVQAGRVEEGRSYIRKALAVAQTVPGHTPLIRTLQGIIHVWLGEALEHTGKIREASQSYARGKEFLGAVRADGANDLRMQVYFSAATIRLAAALVKLGKTEEAKKEYEQSLAVLEPLARGNPDDAEVLYALAETYTGEGMLSATLSQSRHAGEQQLVGWKTARNWFQKSLITWSKVSHPARISMSGFEVTLPVEVSRRLAQCNLKISSLERSDNKPR
jgi:serine/threonine protein kinase/Flp pilus assembly protein TadD